MFTLCFFFMVQSAKFLCVELQIAHSFDMPLCYLSMFQVTVENFLRVLTGRLPPSTPRSKRLLSDDRSNILIYLTGTAQMHKLSTESVRSVYSGNRQLSLSPEWFQVVLSLVLCFCESGFPQTATTNNTGQIHVINNGDLKANRNGARLPVCPVADKTASLRFIRVMRCWWSFSIRITL